MTTLRTIARLAGAAALSLAGGCAQLRAANATPQPMEGQLTATLRQADQEAVALRFGVADRLLADFAETHPGTPEAVETAFWRAVFKLDTANQSGTRRDAVALLDGYLNGPAVVAHRGAAQALRRAASVERTVVTVPAPSTPAAPNAAPSARSDVSAEEVQRLRDELAKANAELERIRKRLSQPKP